MSRDKEKHRAEQKRYRENHPEKCNEWIKSHKNERNAYDRKWRAEHREIDRASTRKYSAQWRKMHPEENKAQNRNSQIRRRFGITQEQYLIMLEIQNGVCNICHHPEKEGRYMAIDHDHLTGKVRGLLCSNCNGVLGFAHDSVDVLYSAIEYLNRTKPQ